MSKSEGQVFREEHDFRPVKHPDKSTPELWADWDPAQIEPDPRIYPLWFDRGSVSNLNNLHGMCSWDENGNPNLVFISPEHHEMLYDKKPGVPEDLELDPRRLPPDVRPGVTLEGDTKVASRRVVKLWNGEYVKGCHLIADKVPQEQEILNGLYSDTLSQLRSSLTEKQEQLKEAWGDKEWFSAAELSDAHLRRAKIMRRTVKWAPTLKGKTMLNKHPDLPRMKGDTRGLLKHRFGVGTGALYYALEENAKAVDTYRQVGPTNVDIVAELSGERIILAEVVTAHHNMDHHVQTFQNLWALSQQNPRYEPHVIFDSRTSLRWLLDYWTTETGADPGVSLASEPRLDWFSNKLDDLYNSRDSNWELARATTIGRLWRQTFGPEAPSRSRSEIESVNW